MRRGVWEGGGSLVYLATWGVPRRLISARGRLGPARPTTLRTRSLMYSARGASGLADSRGCSRSDAELATSVLNEEI